MADQWAKDRATQLCIHHRASPYGIMTYDQWEALQKNIAAALQDAFQRGAKEAADDYRVALAGRPDDPMACCGYKPSQGHDGGCTFFGEGDSEC